MLAGLPDQAGLRPGRPVSRYGQCFLLKSLARSLALSLSRARARSLSLAVSCGRSVPGTVAPEALLYFGPDRAVVPYVLSQLLLFDLSSAAGHHRRDGFASRAAVCSTRACARTPHLGPEHETRSSRPPLRERQQGARCCPEHCEPAPCLHHPWVSSIFGAPQSVSAAASRPNDCLVCRHHLRNASHAPGTRSSPSSENTSQRALRARARHRATLSVLLARGNANRARHRSTQPRFVL